MQKTYGRINVEREVLEELGKLKTKLEKKTNIKMTWTEFLAMLIDTAGVK